MKNSSKKLLLTFAFTLQVLTTTSLQANFELEDINTDAHVKYYNSLPAVEENDKVLKTSSQFTPFLKEAEEIVARYELESTVGLRLIHRHFPLTANQVMAEAYEIVDNIPSLVTYAHTFEEAREKVAIPASWIFPENSEDEVLVFEASNDSAVKSGNLQLQKSTEFFDEMGKLLRDYQLNNLLSVALLKRDLLKAKEEEVYMEVSSSIEPKSIVQIWNVNKNSENATRTSWSFKGPRQQACNGSTFCRAEYDGKHITWYTHTDTSWWQIGRPWQKPRSL